MSTLTAPIVDGAALIERFENEIMQGPHSLSYEYQFSRVKDLLLQHYRDMMPALALRASSLAHVPDNPEVTLLRKLWKMFFQELAPQLHSKTPPENFGFEVWADWIRSEAGL